jgi:hypothetical protein
MHPDQLPPPGDDALVKLEANQDPDAAEQLDKSIRELLDAVRSSDAVQVETRLCRQYAKQGIHGFNPKWSHRCCKGSVITVWVASGGGAEIIPCPGNFSVRW